MFSKDLLDRVVCSSKELCQHVTRLKKTFKTWDEVEAKLADCAKLYVSVSFALASLYYAQLKTRGVDPTKKESVRDHLDRIKCYMKTISELSDGCPDAAVQQDKDVQRPSTLVIDKTASYRLVKHYTSR